MKKYLLVPVALFLVNGLVAQTRDNSYHPIRLIDRQLNLSGSLSEGTAERFVGLEAGDKIILNCSLLSKKGNLSIYIKDLNRGNEIYKKANFDSIRDETIQIPAKGIYLIGLKTAFLIGKDARLTVDRVPGPVADPAGKQVSKPIYDTSAIEVLNTTTRVYAKNSPQSNNTVLPLQLPPNTTFWVYWVGVGKEAREKMDAFAASCSTIGSLFPSDPLVLYGRKFITALPMTTSNARISYHFMDMHNTTAFKNKQQYSFYMFKSAEKITTEYASIHNQQPDLNLGISNESSNTAEEVEIRVVAFVVKPR